MFSCVRDVFLVVFFLRETIQYDLHKYVEGRTNPVWPQDFNKQNIRSDTLYVDTDINITETCFSNDTVTSMCNYFPENLPNCPTNFEVTNNICYIILKNTSYPPQCPYEETVNFSRFVNLTDKSLLPIWMPVQRENGPYGIGLLYWTEPTTQYKTLYSETYYYESSILDKNCLVYVNDTFSQAVSCSSRYNAVCAYEMLHDRKNTYCSQYYSNLCTQSDYSPKSKCFCLGTAGMQNKPKAEFLLPYQNLLYPLLSSDTCYIGLEKAADGYYWVNSHTYLNYTYWSYDVPFGDEFQYGVISKNGWSLERYPERTNYSIIYEVDIPQRDCSLYLSYDGKFMVTASNIGQWLHIEIPDLTIINCFTDASPNYIFNKIIIGKPETINNSITYMFEAHVKGPGNYWCEGFTYPTVEITRSNKILLRDKDKFPGEYVAVLRYKLIRNTNPLTESSILVWHTTIKKVLLNEVFYPRIFAINVIDEMELEITIIWHLTSKSSNDTFEEYVYLKDLLQNSYQYFTLLELLSVDYCMEMTTNATGEVLSWPRTDLNSIAYPLEGFCLTKEGKILTRSCYGDFVYGARWSSNSETCTLFNSSNATLQLLDVLSSNKIFDFYNVLDMLENYYEYLDSIDIFFISQVLSKMSELEQVDEHLVSHLVNSLTRVPKQILRQAQEYFNATDRILYSFNKIIQNSINNIEINESNLIVISSSALSHNLSGVIFKSNNYKIVKGIISLSEVQMLDFETALILSEDLITQIEEIGKKISIIAFFDDALFIDSRNVNNSVNNIFRISVNGLEEEFAGPLSIFNNMNSTSIDDSCSLWTFEIRDNFENIPGSWLKTSYPNQLPSLSQCDFQNSSYVSIIFSNNSSNITATLEDLLDSDAESLDKLNKLRTLTRFASELLPVDIHYISVVLQNAASENVDYLECCFQTVDNLMEVEKSVMVLSQHQYQSTNRILDSINKMARKSLTTQEFIGTNFKVIATDIKSTNMTGIMLENCPDICGIKIIDIFDNLTEIRLSHNYEAIVIFSDEILAHADNEKVVITVFSNDVLFNEYDPAYMRNTTTIIGTYFSNIQKQKYGSISVIYNTHTIDGDSCSIWRTTENIKGSWKKVSNPEHMECKFPDESYSTLLLNDKLNVTANLECILSSDVPALEKQKQLVQLTNEFYGNLEPIDIFLISQILCNVSQTNETDLESTSMVINNLLMVPKDVMEEAQKKYSATDNILYYVDKIFTNYNGSEEVVLNNTNLFQLVIADISQTNLTGLILQSCNVTCELILLQEEIYVNDIKNNRHLDAAIMFSKELIEGLRSSTEAGYVPRIIITVHLNNALFNEETNQRQTTSKIFGILLPDFHHNLQNIGGTITIVYNTEETFADGCAHWKYLVGVEEIKGFWNKDSLGETVDHLSMCIFDHLTHFAMLLANNPLNKYAKNHRILDIITNANCILSAIGIFGILSTGFLFKSWRQNTGNVILLNFSLAISIKIIMLYFNDFIHDHNELTKSFCTICGAILHYSLLSEFCWMLIIAVLQFKRFVEVLGGPPRYILIKSYLCGWFLPLIPVICVIGIDVNNYNESNMGLCYPTGLGLYLGVWLPVIIVVTINLVIFTYIIYNVCHNKSECRDRNNHEILFQWRLAFLLFFMLGLTWIFGFLAQLDGDMSFLLYLFCFTATLQGFIMFLLFIVFNRSTRYLYSHSIKLWLYSKNLKKF